MRISPKKKPSAIWLVVGVIAVLAIVGSLLEKSDVSQPGQAAQKEPWPFSKYALPDLSAQGVKELYIRVNPSTGERELRFNTTITNTGEGPLELYGEYDPELNQTRATQRILNRNNQWEERLIGYFVFHSGHKHWHVEEMTQFEMFTYHEDGTPDELVAATDKMSFCMFDKNPIDLNLPGAATSIQYSRSGCSSGGVQGISVGWSDTYTAGMEGQYLNIEGISDGRYLVRSVSDPTNLIVEKDNTNNSSVVYIEIIGNTVRILPGP